MKIDKAPLLSQRFPPMATVFHLRSVLIAAGVVGLTAWLADLARLRRGKLRWPAMERLLRTLERHYTAALLAMTGLFFLAAYLAKLSQFRSLSLNAEDFWLFEDMLDQMREGGFLITRFAPQALGWVQHGAVHPMFTWVLTLPLAWVFGPIQACLIFGPLVFAGAAWILAELVQPRGGTLAALAVALAFLASSQVGRILMYDVHPEAAYPLFVFAWAWAAGWGDGRVRLIPLLLITLALMGIKEDSFLVLLPLLAWTNLQSIRQKKSVAPWIAASVCAISVTAIQFYCVHGWVAGSWGPSTWKGAPITLPHGAELLRGRHWDTPASAARLALDLAGQKGGVIGTLKGFLLFLFSRPFLSLLLLAPWIAIQLTFWLIALPLLFVLSILDTPSKFINYYSAPVLGLFWFAIAWGICRFGKSGRNTASLWLLIGSLLLGGAGIDFYTSTSLTERAKEEVKALNHCIEGRHSGVVSGPFLGVISQDRVWTDRDPIEQPSAEKVDFYLFSQAVPSYEIPPVVAEQMLVRLKNDTRWIELGPNCLPLKVDQSPTVFLFVRR